MEMSARTEDVYQTLYHPPVVKNTHPPNESARGTKLMVMLLVFNSLFLIVILILIGHFRLGLEENKGVWLLHDNSFYFIWEAEGNCSKAGNYCSAKADNIRLAVLTPKLRDWLITQAKGRRLLVAEDESLSGCKLVGDPVRLETPFTPGEEQGWVCEHQHEFILFYRYYLDHLDHLDHLDQQDPQDQQDHVDFLDHLDYLDLLDLLDQSNVASSM
ncbi:uncharacterized protein [Salminus brasiliensis]|uniref:uncharacterized protein n=1 Tax=Salminus brasiliensis TaxID=930266 RepID=UPI003B830A1A